MSDSIIFFDGDYSLNMRPFSYTRPISELRVGISLIREKWELDLKSKASWISESHLSKKFPVQWTKQVTFLYGGLLPNEALVNQVQHLDQGESLWLNDQLVAFKGNQALWEKYKQEGVAAFKNKTVLDKSCTMISNLYHIYMLNGAAIKYDLRQIESARGTMPLSDTVNVIGDLYAPDGKPNVFLEKGAKAEHCIINVSNGPVYIGKNAEIMEGSMVRGPLALCENAKINMGAKIYGDTTIGPYCKVGGEIHNSVLFAYSNKGHDGFLGHAVIGEWCNIGADTNNSNLRNDYGPVKLWNYASERFELTGQQFCGLMMGDHSKCGINTMFNTGTVLGVASNVVGAGYPRNFIPSFVIGGAGGFKKYPPSRVHPMAERMMARRGIQYNAIEKEIIEFIYAESERFRKGLC